MLLVLADYSQRWECLPFALELQSEIAPSYSSLQNRFVLSMSSREGHPAVQRRCALLTAAAGLDAHGVCRFLDNVSKPDFFFDQKPGKPHSMRLAFRCVRCCRGLLL